MNDTFSKRFGFHQPQAVEITIRQDAPYDLRGLVADFAYRAGFDPHRLRSHVCYILKKREDPDNWSAFPNVDWEARQHLDTCPWYRVYDIIENIAKTMLDDPHRYNVQVFTGELNEYFIENGIGWQLTAGKIELRGSEAFEEAVKTATTKLAANNFQTAQTELREARNDLARRPDPDLSGAIHHSMAALECVAREISGDLKPTLGEVVKKNPGLIPKPLDDAISKAWGYASEVARHRREGHDPEYYETELVVGLAATCITYLINKSDKKFLRGNSHLADSSFR